MGFLEIGSNWRKHRDDHWGWKQISENRWELISQKWRDELWRHELFLVRPSWNSGLDGCFLEVSGDDAGEVDELYAADLAEITGLPVAVLFSVPNQPLFEMREDDLIAHTFEQFLESGDQEWPLLVPMVRSVLAAIDALSEIAGIDQFIVGGASKRGWTSWLCAASGDRRVKGIVPVVFDNLNMAAQMEHQMELWREPSEMVNDYVRRQLHLISESERGGELIALVDPYLQLNAIECPVLVVNGANDAYWSVDALNMYYSELPSGSGAVVVPNLGHSTGERQYWGPALNRFCRSILTGAKFPCLEFEWRGETLKHSCDVEPNATKVWRTESRDLKFWDSSWRKVESGFERCENEFRFDRPLVENSAVFVEFEYKDEDGFWRLNSPAQILRS